MFPRSIERASFGLTLHQKKSTPYSEEPITNSNVKKFLSWVSEQEKIDSFFLGKLLYIQSLPLVSVLLRMAEKSNLKSSTRFALVKGISISYLSDEEAISRPFEEMFAISSFDVKTYRRDEDVKLSDSDSQTPNLLDRLTV